MNILFLGSGGGGNLKFIDKYFSDSNLVNVLGVLTDRKCGALSYAQSSGLYSNILTFKRTETGNEELINEIQGLNPDVIITNVHKILSKEVVKRFESKLINLHYSYLPAFQGAIGMKTVDLAIENNNSFIGTTSHYVSEKVDAGKIITQGVFCRHTCKNIYQKTFECGALTLLSALFYLLKDTVDHRIFEKINISPSSDVIDFRRTKLIFSKLIK